MRESSRFPTRSDFPCHPGLAIFYSQNRNRKSQVKLVVKVPQIDIDARVGYIVRVIHRTKPIEIIDCREFTTWPRFYFGSPWTRMITGDIEPKKKIEGEVGKICWCQHVTKHKTCRVFPSWHRYRFVCTHNTFGEGEEREMRNPGGAKRKILKILTWWLHDHHQNYPRPEELKNVRLLTLLSLFFFFLVLWRLYYVYPKIFWMKYKTHFFWLYVYTSLYPLHTMRHTGVWRQRLWC